MRAHHSAPWVVGIGAILAWFGPAWGDTPPTTAPDFAEAVMGLPEEKRPFHIGLGIPPDPFDPESRWAYLRLDHTGVLECCDGTARKVAVAAPESVVAKVRKAAEAYVTAPAPFVIADTVIADGLQVYVDIWARGKSRPMFISNWGTMPAFNHFLLEFRDALAQADLKPGDRQVVDGEIELWQRLAVDDRDLVLAQHDMAAAGEELLVIENGDPTELLPRLIEMHGKADEPAKDYIRRAAGRLGALRYPSLTPAQTMELIRFVSDSDLYTMDILFHGIQGGSPELLKEFATRFNETTNDRDYGPKTLAMVPKLLDEQTIRQLLVRIRAKELDERSAGAIWRLIVTERDRLRYDIMTGKYRLAAPGGNSGPRTSTTQPAGR